MTEIARREAMPMPEDGWQEDGHRLTFRMTPGWGDPASPFPAVVVDCPVEGGCVKMRDINREWKGWCPLKEELANAGIEAISGFEGDLALPAFLRWRNPSWDWEDGEPLEIEPIERAPGDGSWPCKCGSANTAASTRCYGCGDLKPGWRS